MNDSMACADLGIFNISKSPDSSFWSLDSNGKVPTANDASDLSAIFSDYIYLTGFWAVADISVPTYNYSDLSKNSEKTTLMLAKGAQSDAIDMKEALFVYANASDVGTGGLGLGLDNSGSADSNFISNFVRAGLIDSNSYSLALSPSNSSHPELILGGVSTDKYNGDLCSFDFIPVQDESGAIVTSNNGYTDSLPVVPISGFGVTSNSSGKSLLFSNSYDDKISESNYPKPALIDSRTYYNYLPFSTLIEIAVELNAYYAESLDSWIVDCDAGKSGTVDVYLGNVSINMNISNILYPAHDDNNTELYFTDGDQACFLALLPDYQVGYSILGTPFLRHAYMAVDNEGKQLALGKAVVYGDTGNNSIAKSDGDHSLYPISSGSIPFAKPNNVTDYTGLTLTIPATINITGNISMTSDVIISNGEVFIATGQEPLTNSRTSTAYESTAKASGYSSTHNNVGPQEFPQMWSLAASIFGVIIAML